MRRTVLQFCRHPNSKTGPIRQVYTVIECASTWSISDDHWCKPSCSACREHGIVHAIEAHSKRVMLCESESATTKKLLIIALQHVLTQALYLNLVQVFICQSTKKIFNKKFFEYTYAKQPGMSNSEHRARIQKSHDVLARTMRPASDRRSERIHCWSQKASSFLESIKQSCIRRD